MKKNKSGTECQETKTSSFKTSIAARAAASLIIFEYCDCWNVKKHTWAFYQWVLFSFPIQFPPHIESWKVAPIIGVCCEYWKLYESLLSFIQEIWRSDMTCLTLANTFNSEINLQPGSSPVCYYSLSLPSFSSSHLFGMSTSKVWGTAVYSQLP